MKRDLYWDSLKFVLIYLVVYGHIVPNYSEDSRFNMAIFNLIYLFHMPLFIFISGRFSHIRDREKYKKGIWRLLETYVVFQVIRSPIYLITGKSSILGCIVTPNWILWYLVALIYWRLLIYYIPESWLKKQKQMIIGSLCISLLAGFIPIGYPFVVQRTLTFLPFFIMGYYSTEIDIKQYISKIPRIVTIPILGCAFLVLFLWLNRNLSFVHHCSFPYWGGDFLHVMIRLAARCVFIPSAIILSIAVMRLTPTHQTLAKWGSITMFIYIYHSFAVNFLNAIIKRGYIPQNELLLFAYSIAIMLCLLTLSRFRLFNILLNPLTYIKERNKKAC